MPKVWNGAHGDALSFAVETPSLWRRANILTFFSFFRPETLIFYAPGLQRIPAVLHARCPLSNPRRQISSNLPLSSTDNRYQNVLQPSRTPPMSDTRTPWDEKPCGSPYGSAHPQHRLPPSFRRPSSSLESATSILWDAPGCLRRP